MNGRRNIFCRLRGRVQALVHGRQNISYRLRGRVQALVPLALVHGRQNISYRLRARVQALVHGHDCIPFPLRECDLRGHDEHGILHESFPFSHNISTKPFFFLHGHDRDRVRGRDRGRVRGHAHGHVRDRGQHDRDHHLLSDSDRLQNEES